MEVEFSSDDFPILDLGDFWGSMLSFGGVPSLKLTASLPLKMDFFWRKVKVCVWVQDRPIFRGKLAVSFRECTSLEETIYTWLVGYLNGPQHWSDQLCNYAIKGLKWCNKSRETTHQGTKIIEEISLISWDVEVPANTWVVFMFKTFVRFHKTGWRKQELIMDYYKQQPNSL